MKRLLFAAAVSALSGPATAQGVEGWTDVFSPRQFLGAIVQYGVFAVRTQTGFTYSGLSVDPMENRLTLYDAQIRPDIGAAPGRDCTIAIDRLSLKGAPWGELASIRIGMDMAGLRLSPDCMATPPLFALRTVGMGGLDIPRLRLEIRHDLPSGASEFLAQGMIDGIGSVTLEADFDYLAIGPGIGRQDDPRPVGTLKHARLVYEDAGGWDRFSPLMSPELANPATGPSRLLALLGSMRGEIIGEAPDPSVAKGFDGFAESVSRVAPQFLADPSTLVIETGFDPAAPVPVDPETYDRAPERLFADLLPVVSVQTVRATAMPAVATLGSVLSDDSDSVEETRKVGLALLTGQGAPRNTAKAIEILTAIPDEGDGVGALEIASLLAEDQPEQAYPFALEASRRQTAGAAAVLDAIEPNLPPKVLFELQDGLDDLRAEMPADVASMRDLAQGYFDGRSGRSYVLAAYWARLAAAAGDETSRFLLDDIADRVTALDAREDWKLLEEQVATRALEDWMSFDLPSRLAAPDKD